MRAYRSPLAHAKIKSINTENAKKIPGVLNIFTINDIEKIAYATNTGSNAGYMNRQRRGPMASGNMTHAWIGSGFSHGPGPGYSPGPGLVLVGCGGCDAM